jgi:hypothetical protein
LPLAEVVHVKQEVSISHSVPQKGSCVVDNGLPKMVHWHCTGALGLGFRFKDLGLLRRCYIVGASCQHYSLHIADSINI